MTTLRSRFLVIAIAPIVSLCGAGCTDLSLADKRHESGGTASVGGTSNTRTTASSGGLSGSEGGAPSSRATATASGGATGAGTPSTGGNAPVGGAASSGGAWATGGGAANSGGAWTTGGVAASGGIMATGGAASTGGSPTNTSAQALGGASSGGFAATGGAASTGGSPTNTSAQALGGATSGGAASTGGSPTNTSAQALGGVTSGGFAATGGNANATGGAPAAPGSGGAGTGGTGGAGTGELPTGGVSSIATNTLVSSIGGSDAGFPVATWQPCGTAWVTTLAQSPRLADNVVVGCSNGDIYSTHDGLSVEAIWTKIDPESGASALPNNPVNSLAVDPGDFDTMYVAFAGSKQGRKLWKTTTGGTSWSELSGIPLSEIWTISVNPLDARKVFVFGPAGVMMSRDSGVTWSADVSQEPLNVSLAADAALSTVSVAVGQPDVIWIGCTNGDIFYTESATTTQVWYKASHNMPERAVTHLALDTTRSPVTAYATFDGMGQDSIWVTSNNGFGWAIWQNPNLPTTPQPVPHVYAFYGISINPIASNVFYIDGTYGVGLSTTGGTSWAWTATN